jgi:hypothetical protein
MTDSLNSFEVAALDAALSGDSEWMNVLRLQIPYLMVLSRSYNSAGGYTSFGICGTPQMAVIPDNVTNYPAVSAVSHPELIHGGAVIVWALNGVIDYLEAVSDGDGEWPVGRENEVLFIR